MTNAPPECEIVLISRFNLPHPLWKDRSAEDYRTWLDERIRLFRELTAPCVRNCYDKPDRWLIIVDTRTYDFVNQLEASVAGIPTTFVPYKGLNLSDTIRGALGELEFPRRVITCRLDTDDLIHGGFFRRLRSTPVSDLEAREGTLFSFPGGCIYDREGDVFYFDSYPNNPFLAYLEECDRAEDLQTVFVAQHIDMIKHSKHAKFLRTFVPFWASTVHEINIANQSLKSSMKISMKETFALKQQFGIAKG